MTAPKIIASNLEITRVIERASTALITADPVQNATALLLAHLLDAMEDEGVYEIQIPGDESPDTVVCSAAAGVRMDWTAALLLARAALDKDAQS